MEQVIVFDEATEKWLQEKMLRLRRRIRQIFCPIINGGHEMYRAYSDDRIFHQCLLCGKESIGWKIDRRDR